MLTPLAFLMFQEGMRATRPTYFAPVFVGLLVAGGHRLVDRLCAWFRPGACVRRLDALV